MHPCMAVQDSGRTRFRRTGVPQSLGERQVDAVNGALSTHPHVQDSEVSAESRNFSAKIPDPVFLQSRLHAGKVP